VIRKTPKKALLCMRVADMPVPVHGSVPRSCHRCGTDIWVSPASEEAAGADAMILCIPCAASLRPLPADFLPLTELQIDELRDRLKGES